MNAITVNYSLRDNQAAGTKPRDNDAYWDKEQHRLLLREGVDPETLRDAAAKSIAAQFFGDSKSADTEAEFFKLLMATPARGTKIKNEHADWNLNAEQEAWLREQNWQTILIDIEAEEPPPAPRPNRQITTASSGNVAQLVLANTTAESSRPSTTQKIPETAVVKQTSSATSTTAESTAEHSSQKRAEVKLGKRLKRNDRRSPEPRTSQGGHTTNRPEDAAQRQAEQDEKKRVERAGIECAKRYLREVLNYTEVREMDQTSPGFDLLAKQASEELRIELKSHKSTAKTLVLTKPEWDEYQRCQREKRAWELWNIENALTNTPTITRYNTIPISAIMPRQYELKLSDCFHSENGDVL